jgi:hypothetical protein
MEFWVVSCKDAYIAGTLFSVTKNTGLFCNGLHSRYTIFRYKKTLDSFATGLVHQHLKIAAKRANMNFDQKRRSRFPIPELKLVVVRKCISHLPASPWPTNMRTAIPTMRTLRNVTALCLVMCVRHWMVEHVWEGLTSATQVK